MIFILTLVLLWCVHTACTVQTQLLHLSDKAKIILSESFATLKSTASGIPQYWKALRINRQVLQQSNVLILISDTGGGHRASAEGLSEALTSQYPGQFNVTVLDILTRFASPPYNHCVASYRIAAQHPTCWKFLVDLTTTIVGRYAMEKSMALLCYGGFRRALFSHRPDVVISMHPLCNTLPLQVLRDMEKSMAHEVSGISCDNNHKKKRVPFITVVTDLGCAHSTWFNPDVDICIVPTQHMKDSALKEKLRSEQVVVHGLPIRSSFLKQSLPSVAVPFGSQIRFPRSVCRKAHVKAALKESLGLRPNAKTVMLLSGGDGVGNLESLTKAILQELQLLQSEKGLDVQLVVVCGNNAIVQQALMKVVACDASKYRQQYQHQHTNNARSSDSSTSDGAVCRIQKQRVFVVVKGFVDNMSDWMRASDLLVTKAGPGTICEAVHCGLPVVITSFLPGQVQW